jgi:lipopolysaccharide transport system ATP-binding protein
MSFAIRADKLGKMYYLGATHDGSLRELASGVLKRLFGHSDTLLPHEEAELRELGDREVGKDGSFWALRDVSLEVKIGEVVAVIGPNGSGKSTLLKILSQITAPTTGRVEIHGRVASLLEVGTGFHPELSGRENVFLNGAILGMSKREIRRKFDEIVAFSEIDKFIDTPVKRYSSGMHVRLAFAVAAHLDPEILIVDEVLSVGDMNFQKKCLDKINGVSHQGKTVLVVSHNMEAVQDLSKRAFHLEKGRLVDSGKTRDVVTEYLAEAEPLDEVPSPMVETRTHPKRSREMKSIIHRVSLHAADGTPKMDFCQSEPMVLRFQYDASEQGIDLSGAGVLIMTDYGVNVGGYNTYMGTMPPWTIPAKGTVEFVFKKPVLTPGRYFFSVCVGSDPTVLEDMIQRIISFNVHSKDVYQTGYLLTPGDGVVALECDYHVTLM